jgi:hypothetical protein
VLNTLYPESVHISKRGRIVSDREAKYVLVILSDLEKLSIRSPAIFNFKHTLRATSWQCQTATTFHLELLMHMIALCLIRIAMFAASRLKNDPFIDPKGAQNDTCVPAAQKPDTVKDNIPSG